MPAYRNRPDRRKVSLIGPELVSNPIMQFTCEDTGGGEVLFTFDQDVITVDLLDPVFLNSLRIWVPGADFEGVASSVNGATSNGFHAFFTQGPNSGDFAACWIFDSTNILRGATTGARCTGNPSIFEGV